jgi:hypothetical protein
MRGILGDAIEDLLEPVAGVGEGDGFHFRGTCLSICTITRTVGRRVKGGWPSLGRRLRRVFSRQNKRNVAVCNGVLDCCNR